MSEPRPAISYPGMLELHVKSRTEYWLECSRCLQVLQADECADGNFLREAYEDGWRAVEGECLCIDCVKEKEAGRW